MTANEQFNIRDRFIEYAEKHHIPPVLIVPGNIRVYVYISGGSAFNYYFSKRRNIQLNQNAQNILKTPDIDLKFIVSRSTNALEQHIIKQSCIAWVDIYIRGFLNSLAPSMRAAYSAINRRFATVSDELLMGFTKESYHNRGWTNGFSGLLLYSLVAYYATFPRQNGRMDKLQFLDVSIGEKNGMDETWINGAYNVPILKPEYMFKEQAWMIIASFLSKDYQIRIRNPFVQPNLVTTPGYEERRLKGEKDMKRLMLLSAAMGTETRAAKILHKLYHDFFVTHTKGNAVTDIYFFKNTLKNNKAFAMNNTANKDQLASSFISFLEQNQIARKQPLFGLGWAYVYLSGGMGLRYMAHKNKIMNQATALNRYVVDKTDDFDFKYVLDSPITTTAKLQTAVNSMNAVFGPLITHFAERIGATLVVRQLFPSSRTPLNIKTSQSIQNPEGTKILYYIRTYSLVIGGKTMDLVDTTLMYNAHMSENRLSTTSSIPVLTKPWMLKEQAYVLTKCIISNAPQNARRNPINGSNSLKGYKNLRRSSALCTFLHANMQHSEVCTHLRQLAVNINRLNKPAARVSSQRIQELLGHV